MSASHITILLSLILLLSTSLSNTSIYGKCVSFRFEKFLIEFKLLYISLLNSSRDPKSSTMTNCILIHHSIKGF